MARGRGIKRSWGGRGGITNKGGAGSKLPPNTSQMDVSKSSIPTSQQVGLNQCIVSSHESSSQHIVLTSQEANAQQITTPKNVGGQQEAHTSLDVGRQQTPFSQNVGAQQESPNQDVSPEQTLASFESSNPQGRQDTHGGIKSLRVNGDTFSRPWHYLRKVPKHVQDKMFNDFENSDINGSIAFAECIRRHKELTGKDLRNDELFLMTHTNKNEKKWICGKSKRKWNTFTNTIKVKVGETSTLSNEEGLEVEDGGMERNTSTNGEDEGEKTSEDDVNLFKTVSEEQLLKTWIETVGGTKKGKIYGLGSRNYLLADSKNSNCASSIAQNPSNIPTQQTFETPQFQQLLDCVLEQWMTNMQEHVQMDIRENMEAQVTIVVRAAVARMLGFTPQPPPDGSGSRQRGKCQGKGAKPKPKDKADPSLEYTAPPSRVEPQTVACDLVAPIAKPLPQLHEQDHGSWSTPRLMKVTRGGGRGHLNEVSTRRVPSKLGFKASMFPQNLGFQSKSCVFFQNVSNSLSMADYDWIDVLLLGYDEITPWTHDFPIFKL
ncbi:hypothetical protein KY284_001146 [Solanum tuberosum]|nr:hypothetical protein KY284_001146 [Solanum tuberosum]